MKILITGVTGQVGALAAKRYLDNKHTVVGLHRRSSNMWRLKELGISPILESGDITDATSMFNIINNHRPTVIFNTAAASHVGESFKTPDVALQHTGAAVLNLLESVRKVGDWYRPIIVHCSSSEMFGSNFSFVNQEGKLEHSNLDLLANKQLPNGAFQDENTPLAANSPYAAAKIYAHNICDLYRRSYGMHIITPIFFNMESSLRTEDFVTRKITSYIGKLEAGLTNNFLFLGNLDARRDWSHVNDSLTAVDLMIEKQKFEDFVVCSEKTHTIKEFCNQAFGLVNKNYMDYVRVSEKFFRPCEVPYLLGSSKKLKSLGWTQENTFDDLVQEMVQTDVRRSGK